MDFRSLRFKLTLWYVLILGILLISFSALLYLTLSRSLYQEVDRKLRILAEAIASESTSPLSKFTFGTIDQALEASMNLRPIGKFIQVLDESGRIGRTSENLKNTQLPITLKALRNGAKGLITYETNRSIHNTPLRIITYPVMEQNQVTKMIQVASSLEDVEEALDTLLLILCVTVPSILLIASLGGLFLANKALKPVDQITQTARMITSQNLNQRIQTSKVKDEISRLIDTFNEMISRLDHSFRQIKQFTTDASHELKTPLTILKGEVEVALRKRREPYEYEQILQSNLEEIDRMSKIVEDLLLLSKADIGEIRLSREEIHLKQLLCELTEQMKILARPKNIEIRMVSEEPNGAEEVHILGDPLRMRELFINLIDNGIKYTEPGGTVSISLTKEKNDVLPSNPHDPQPKVNFAKITITDTGIGISQEDQKKIFNRFYRVDKARSREQGGSGLGLSICKWIVEAHQGEISVQSELGKGSTFIVRLPLLSPGPSVDKY
ncbi:MAG: HAMP domain-containing histidine kinase [Desulfobacterota bacterium]|nr:HAMP domain-containing histidine kinase [Thermodesulfobacteriota bacterium]